MSVFTGGLYGRLAIMLNTLSSLNIDIIIIDSRSVAIVYIRVHLNILKLG